MLNQKDFKRIGDNIEEINNYTGFLLFKSGVTVWLMFVREGENLGEISIEDYKKRGEDIEHFQTMIGQTTFKTQHYILTKLSMQNSYVRFLNPEEVKILSTLFEKKRGDSWEKFIKWCFVHKEVNISNYLQFEINDYPIY